MNIEEPNKNKIERGKETLMNLEKEGIYVFHGLPELLEELEPRQPKTYDYNLKQMVNDGEPAVVATPSAEVAIFRAAVNKNLRVDGKHQSSFGWSKNRSKVSMEYKTTQEILDKARESKGYIYVFRKDDFEKHRELEYRAYKYLKTNSNILHPAELIKGG